MPHPEDDADFDFDAELRGLFQEAQQDIESRAATSRKPDEARPPDAPPAPAAEAPVATVEPIAETPPPLPSPAAFPQMLRPVVLGIEAMTRAAGESTAILGKLDKANTAAADAHRALPQIVTDLRGLIDQKTGLNQRMFDALHEELRGYKDGFLLDSVHRPIIRDIISLYDDIAEIHRQVQSTVGEHREVVDPLFLLTRMRTLEMNLEHNLGFILEVLARLEVTQMPVGSGKLDKRTQRAVAVELAEESEEDTVIVRQVKCGFFWKERVVRAEEVVIKKYKEGFLVALPATPPSM